MSEELAISGVIIIPFVIGLIQFAKQFVPGVAGSGWLAGVLMLSTGLAIAVAVGNEPPITPADWLGVVVVGLSFGLTAAKIYDAQVK